jgi:predicted DsbA family dithiol-disulfide isomerase
LKQDYDVEVTWEPFLLRGDVPEGGMPNPRDIQSKQQAFGGRLLQMAEEAGLQMVLPDWMPNTRRALAATEYAKDQGKGDAFHRAVFHRFYGEGENIEDWLVLRAVAQEVGLDPDEMQEQTDSPKYKSLLEQKFREAYQLGVSGVPLYVFDHQYGISGAQPYAMFQRFMDEYLSGQIKP